MRILPWPRRRGRRDGAGPDALGRWSLRICAATRSARCFVQGGPTRGCRLLTLSDADLGAIVAFIHDPEVEIRGARRRTSLRRPRRSGNRQRSSRQPLFQRSRRMFRLPFRQPAISRESPPDIRDWRCFNGCFIPAGRPAPARPKVTVTLASGRKSSPRWPARTNSPLWFSITRGRPSDLQESAVKFKIDDPMSAHFDQLGKYTDADMHNVFAYLDTLK